MAKDLKRYFCPRNHVVGFVHQVGHGVARLAFLRNSLLVQEVTEADYVLDDLMVTAVIDSGEVTCTICGAVMTWVPNPATLDRLMHKYRKLV